MPALGEYANVMDTAIAVLEQKGYDVWYEPDSDLVYAQRDGWDFAADSPIGLLGLVAIYETKAPTEFGEYWWRTEPRVTFDDLPEEAPAYDPVIRRR